jgi:hypothetical protein
MDTKMHKAIKYPNIHVYKTEEIINYRNSVLQNIQLRLFI